MTRLLYLILALLVFNSSASAQLFYKLKITSDAYGIEKLDKSKITQIYVNDSAAENDLSMLPYVQKLRLRLYNLGYSVTKDKSKAKFILNWNVEVKGPIISVSQGTTRAANTTQTITYKNDEGKEKTAEVTIPGELVPHYSEDHFYDKTLHLELRLIASGRLIWQSKATITDYKTEHGNYSSYLVFDATYWFLGSTTRHPQESFYTRKQLRRIDEIFQVW